jgi:hypothetical protein
MVYQIKSTQTFKQISGLFIVLKNYFFVGKIHFSVYSY